MAKLFANSEDPDQMPRSAASGLGLHCLPITFLRVSRLLWVKHVCLTSKTVYTLIGKDLLPFKRGFRCRKANRKSQNFITKTCLHNFDPLKPHFHIVKLGLAGVYIIFLISAQNIECGYSLEPPQRGGSNEYPQSMFWAEMWKKLSEVFIWKFSAFGGEIFYIFE